MVGVVHDEKPSSLSNEVIHCTSVVVEATDPNSASVELLARVFCLLELHEMGLEPK